MSAEHDLPFIHHFSAGTRDLTVLALHGTGANEHDLVPLAQQLAPGAAILSPRGQVSENGMPRFFKRLAEGVFDKEDLITRTHELADFVKAASEHYSFDTHKLVALGFSNGANIGSALMFLRPETLAHAALLRPMVPLELEHLPDLSGKKIFLASGQHDPLVPLDNAARLEQMYQNAGAEVTHEWSPAGHGLIQPDLQAAKGWFDHL